MFKGSNGVKMFTEILNIANEVGALMQEVRERLIPLLDQKQYEEYEAEVAGRLKRGADSTKAKPRSKIPMKTLPDENRNAILESFKRGPEGRDQVYRYFETKEMRAVLKGDKGIDVYLEILEIAREAGASNDEARDRLIPLLDKEQLAEYTKEVARKIINSGALETAAESKLALMKAKVKEQKQRHEEFLAFEKAEQQKRIKKTWLQRLMR